MENFEKRLGEIIARKTEIRSILKGESDVNLDEIQAELEKLETEETEIRSRLEIADGITTEKIETRTIEKPKTEVKKMNNDNIFGSVEYRTAFKNWIVNGTAIPQEYRDAYAPLTHSGNTSAGAVIPTTTLNLVADKLEDYGHILPLVTRTNYASGVSIPTNAIAYNATWVAETARTNTDTQIELSSVVFNAYLLKMSFALSLQVATMSIDAFDSWIAGKIASGITRALETAILSGTGSNQPTGILTQAAVAGVATQMASEGRVVTAAALDYDAVISIERAIPAAYDGLDVLLMNKKTFVSLRGVKDDNKRPIVESLDVMNKSLFGRPVVFTDQLPAFDTASANDVVVVAFNMRDYYINVAAEIQFRDYYDEIYEQTIKKGLLLVDGKPVLMDSCVVLKKA